MQHFERLILDGFRSLCHPPLHSRQHNQLGHSIFPVLAQEPRVLGASVAHFATARRDERWGDTYEVDSVIPRFMRGIHPTACSDTSRKLDPGDERWDGKN